MTKEELIKTTLEEIAKEKGLKRVEVTSYDLVNRFAEKLVNKTNDIHDVSEMFDFAGYLYGNFDYYDNTKDGDIYIHNDNGLKYTREKVYQQWIGIRNSR